MKATWQYELRALLPLGALPAVFGLCREPGAEGESLFFLVIE